MPEILKLNEVAKLIGVGRSTLFRMISMGEFPGGFIVGARSRRWTGEMIQKWIDKKAAKTR